MPQSTTVESNRKQVAGPSSELHLASAILAHSPPMRKTLDLHDLLEENPDRPGLNLTWGRVCVDGVILSYAHTGRVLPTTMTVSGRENYDADVVGPEASPNAGTSTSRDEAVEYGATGIAVLIAQNDLEMTVVDRSQNDGGGFDYYLGPKAGPSTRPPSPVPNAVSSALQNKQAVLEVSGILKGAPGIIAQRYKDKKARFDRAKPAYPAFVCVVEFSLSVARFDQYA